MISPKRDFTPEQNSENPEDDFLNTEGKIISFILCQKNIWQRTSGSVNEKAYEFPQSNFGHRILNRLAFWKSEEISVKIL